MNNHQDLMASIRGRVLELNLEEKLIAHARALVAVASPNPPLATGAVAEAAESIIRSALPNAEIELHRSSPEVVNLVARIKGRGPGRRLVFSGHLDTFPIGEDLGWTVDPLGGHLVDGKLYGRGVSDMKGGVAASIAALSFLANHHDSWSGEAVIALNGDEESMGELGAQFLIDHVPHVRGDAVIIGDVGSSRVIRFGEKGFLWVTIVAFGSPAHGAHVHKGINAIDRLRSAMDALSCLRTLDVNMPEAIGRAIAEAKSISEDQSGAGEAEVLSSLTINLGRIEGGVSPNLIPSHAKVAADIRIPVGLSAATVEETLRAALAEIEGIKLTVDRCVDPSFTDPNAEIIKLTAAAVSELLKKPFAVNMRVGASDARVFRKAGIPTVVFGPTPFNMGGADEYVLVDELVDVARVQALTAFDFLKC